MRSPQTLNWCLHNTKPYSTIFTTKNNELAIFGKTIDDVRNKIDKFNELRKKGNLFGENGAFASLFSGKKLNNIITPETLKQFDEFKQKFNSSSLSAEALAEQMENVDQRIIDYAKTCKNGEMTTEGFKASIDTMSFSAKAGKVALQALATAGNMLAMWAISKAISFATEKLDEFAHAAENAKEKAKTSKQELDSLTSEINDLNKELETTKDRIIELLEKANSGTISLLEEEELDNLREQNDELQREIALKEKLAEIDAKEAADNAAYSLTYRTDDNKWDDEYNATDRIDKLQKYVDSANFYQDKLSEINQQILDIEKSATDNSYKDDSVYKDLIKHQTEYQEGLKKVEEQMSSTYKELSVEDDGLYYNGKVIEGYEDLAERLDTVYMTVELYLDEDNVKDTTRDYIETIKSKLIDSGLSDEISSAVSEGFSEEELNSIMNSDSIDWSQCLGLEDATDVIENIKEQLASITANENPISISTQLTKSTEPLDKFQSSVKSAADAYATLLSGNYSSSELLDSIQTINQAVTDMGGTLDWEFINNQSTMDSLELLGMAIGHISEKYAESVLSGAGIDVNSEFGKMLANIIKEAYEVEAQFTGMNSQLDNLQSSYKTLTGILESYNETGYISLDNLQSLLTADENLIAMLEVENGQLAINQEAYENLVAAQLMEFKAKLNDAAAAEIEALAKNKAEQATNNNASASNNAVEKLDAETVAINRNTSAAISNAVAKAEESGVSEGEIQGVLDKYNEVWNATLNNFSGDFSGFMGGGSKSAGKAGKEAADAYLESFEKELKDLDDLKDRGKITEKQYLDALRRLYLKYFRDKKKYLKEYEKYEHQYLEGMKSLYESALSGITSILDKQISAYEDSKSAAVDTLEAERDAAIEAKEAEKERYEEQIKSIDKEIEAKEKVIDGINDEINAIREANDERQRQLDLQKAQYELERMQNQKTILQYSSDKGMHYVTDTSGIRDAKDAVEDAQTEITIANKEKEIKLIEKEIDLLEERKDLINEQIDLLDEQIDQINQQYDKMIADTEKYWDNLIKGMEDYKSRWEELAELEEQAKIIETLRSLGIETDDILNMSEEAFARFKDEYISILADIYSGNDSMLSALSDTTGRSVDEMGSYITATQGYIDSLSSIGESLNPVAEAIGDVDENMSGLSSAASEANTNLSKAATSAGEVSTNVGNLETNLTNINSLVTEEQTAFNNLKTKIDEVIEAINLKTEAVKAEQEAVGIATSSEMADFLLLKEKILKVKETLESLGTQDEGLISNIVTAISSLNDIKLEDGIIGQFTQLKAAIDSVSSAISGGSESSDGEGQGSNSGSGNSGKSVGNNSEGGSNSLTGAITSMGETAAEVIGEPDAEGDGTVIGEFGALETAVTDVTSAIGGGESEGGEGQGKGSGSEGEDGEGTLIGSIENLGETTEEVLGEPGGEGVIGRFEKFKEPIQEAETHVKGISTGLDEIDGKEVECTIKVNIELSGSTGFTGSAQVLGSMNLNSAEYNAKYTGASHAEGTAMVSGNWAVQSDEQNALVGEVGRELIVRGGRFFTVGDNGAEMFDIKKGDIVFNHEQTEDLLKHGHISGRGKAYADGTVGGGKILTKDGSILRPLQPGDKMYDLVQKFDAYFKSMDGNLEKLVPNSFYEHQRQMEDMAKQINYVSSVTNNNRNTQPVVNHINVTCPGVTSQQVAEQLGSVLGKELDKQFSGFHNWTDQKSRIR